MITSQEYIRNSDRQRDLLAAFSALDHSVTEAMPPNEIQACFGRLLFRLLAISEVHGPGTARWFIQALDQADPDDVLGTAFNFIEIGRPPTCELDRELVQRRELQQEILHFSRIVALQDGTSAFQNKRMRNSKLIPASLKVLCEFLTLARSRMVQRGRWVPCPRSRPDQQVQSVVGTDSLLVHDREPSDYLLVLSGGGAAIQRDLALLFASLLTYLTPYEGFTALVVHVMETRPACDAITFSLVEPPENGRLPSAHWAWSRQEGGADLLETCFNNLPTRQMQDPGAPLDLPGGEDRSLVANTALSDFPGGARVMFPEEDGSPGIALASPSLGFCSKEDLVARALRLFQARCDKEILSLESGHIHLDRSIDEDQTLGSAIGYTLYRHLALVQQRPPHLCPMVDDDHVLVQLAAKDFEAFFRSQNPDAPFGLIPESSPIVRAIACGLLAVITDIPAKRQRMFLQGGNLVLRVPEENILCELFEDFHGKCDTGCVLFEVALLIYRSDPGRFTEGFQTLFGLQEDVHARILEALNPDRPHDEIIAELRTLAGRFKAATDPHRPCQFFKNLVGTFLSVQERLHVHLNVLEDYYESQQFKVRRLLRFLDVPVHLWSLHFNRMTGRIHVERRLQPRED